MSFFFLTLHIHIYIYYIKMTMYDLPPYFCPCCAGGAAVSLHISVPVSVSVHLCGVWLEDLCAGGLQP